MLTNPLSWLRDRVATLASSSGKRTDSSPSSTFRGGDESVGADTRSGPIAILEVHAGDLGVALDSEALFYEVTDVATAMKHASVFPAGRYVVFRDTSGRILLQEPSRCLSSGAKNTLLRKLGRV